MLGSGGGDLTLEDFLEQMMMVRRMGPIGNLLGMLPGMGQMKDALAQVDDKDLDRVAAIIRSMTPAERHDPKILNGSRRLRIARGSGVTVTEVNQLVDRFYDARKMMKQMAGGMGIPGMPGMRRPSKKGGRKGGKPGKPAKRSGGNPARGVTPPAALPQLPPGMSLPPGLAADLSNLKLPPD
jgi:signal recognition particle subunit SRP54